VTDVAEPGTSGEPALAFTISTIKAGDTSGASPVAAYIRVENGSSFRTWSSTAAASSFQPDGSGSRVNAPSGAIATGNVREVADSLDGVTSGVGRLVITINPATVAAAPASAAIHTTRLRRRPLCARSSRRSSVTGANGCSELNASTSVIVIGDPVRNNTFPR
jgi:hypothetical protein